ncbi:MAG TPA: ABC transporter substrate-binding protein [Candidatus Binatia bacterium]|nr:ABC transporter substrate-binding protein [Candidatus Binatia bacterium]
MSRCGIAVAVLAASLCGARAGQGATALDYTRDVLDRARAIVNTDHPHNQKLAELEAVLSDFLDTDQMGRDALDEHWKQFSAAQQKEFLRLFRTLFQRTYLQKLLFFEKPDFVYVGEAPGDGFARVDTKILTPKDEFAVTYRMRPSGSHWLATDIQVEDLSLTNNFRQQLDRQLSKGSAEALLDGMRKKYGGKDDAL